MKRNKSPEKKDGNHGTDKIKTRFPKKMEPF